MRRVLLAFMFLWPAVMFAQPVSSAVLLSVNDGLSQGMVFDILQSRDGFLWIATKDGLNRYDGYRFEAYLPDPFNPFAAGANEIRQIFEDGRGRLWLGYEGGLDVFLPGEERFFHLPMSGAPGFTRYVSAFAEMPDGSVWLECNGYLWRIILSDGDLRGAAASGSAFPRFTYARVAAPDSAAFISCFRRRDGALLATTANGLYQITELASARPGCALLQGSDRALHLLGEDTSGGVYLYSAEGLWRLGAGAGTPRKILDIAAGKTWCVDLAGNFWAQQGAWLWQWRPGHPDKGVELIREIALEYPFALSDGFYMTGLTLDGGGNAWLGTSGYGLLKVPTAPPKFRSYLPLASQRQIAEDPGGNLICLREPRTLHLGNRFEQRCPNPWLSQIPEGETICLAFFDQEGACWLRGCNNMLYRVDARTKTPVRLALEGMSLLLSRTGKVMAVTEKELLVHDPATGQTKRHPFGLPLRLHYNASSEHILLYEDSAGDIWITAFEGLIQATPQAAGYRFRHFRNDPNDRASLSNNFVLCVADDPREPRRYLWIATKGGGLNCLDRQSGRMTHYGPEHGLPDRVLYGLLPDAGGHLWITTNKGLCRMSPEGDRPVFKNFTAADGLQSSEFNQSSFLKMKDGTLVFGGVNGLTVFHPDSLRFRANPPVTRIVGIRAAGRRHSAQVARPLELRHDQNLLLFEFAALDFTNPAQNQYRYQLLRGSIFGGAAAEAWTDLGHSNSVQLANLRPGRYTFRVLGSNDEGTWSQTPAEASFVIHPPWWAAWWAYLGYAALLAFALAAYFRFRLRRRLAEQEALRLRELDEFKSRFFTNITHEFRTPLTVILGTSEQLAAGMEEEEGRLPKSKFRQQIALIKRSGENLLRLINQILDLAKLESKTLNLNYVHGDVPAYLRYIAESMHSLANARGVSLRVECPEPEIIMDYDPDRLLQIVHNLLSNAIKFTPAGGKVNLRMTIDDLRPGGQGSSIVNRHSSIVIQVSDTGTGIPPEDLPYIFDRFFQAGNLEKAGAGGTGIGLALTKELVKAMGGSISVESEVGKGTAFTIKLPLKKVESSLAAPFPAQPHNLAPMPMASPLVGLERNTPAGAGQAPEDASLPSVLLIEDNPDVLEYLAACLQDTYQPDFAFNGRDGIEKALETVPDLIVSDVMMPEKDGFEVVQTLKNDERTSHIPIVLLTARVDVESRIAGLRRGADAYLAKPFHREELLATLNNLLELRKKLQAKYGTINLHTPTPAGGPEPDLEDAFVAKVKSAILEHLSDADFNVEALCRDLAMSRPQLHRKLTALTGMNSTQYIRSLRLSRAKELLLLREMNVSEVAFAVGFDDPKYFSRVFIEEFGVAPSKI